MILNHQETGCFLKFNYPLYSVLTLGPMGCQECVKSWKTYLLMISILFRELNNFKLIMKNFKIYTDLKKWLLSASQLKIVFYVNCLKVQFKSYTLQEIFEDYVKIFKEKWHDLTILPFLFCITSNTF